MTETLKIRPEWIRAYVAHEAERGVGGVLLVRPPDQCAYVMITEGKFPADLANGLVDAMEHDPSSAFFVVEHARELTVLKMSKCQLFSHVCADDARSESV
jgi:hypothetical protein